MAPVIRDATPADVADIAALYAAEVREGVNTYEIDPPDAAVLPAGVPVHASGWVRTLPGMLSDGGGLDGFFMARLRRA